ncbi:neuropeptide Y receptor type 2 isoform X2 [Diachasma alloeum]|uniref:neuropeptide Y receptor type 2 isoform X2 n=1 Tax=Diachasma alloeum TaxID=454923 RepID=UPI0007381445|nr:neuropeptide Y receptor type 2 isoform X2 [Diachasma alloeum]
MNSRNEQLRLNPQRLQVTVLSLIFITAIGTNVGIIVCIIHYKEMQTPTNRCLVNLAVADLLFAVGIPAVAYTRLTQSWSLGETMCKFLPYSQLVCGFVLLWTLTLISIDRYRCLAVSPYRSVLSKSRVYVASAITWATGVTLFLPVALWFTTLESIDKKTICTLIFPISQVVDMSLCFIIPTVIVACFLPMCLLVYHYHKIFQRIIDARSRWAVPCVSQTTEAPGTRRDSELSVIGSLGLVAWAGRKYSGTSITGRQGRTGSLSQSEEIRLHRHLKVVRILLLNVIVVLAMWLPITIIMLLIYVDGHRPTEDTDFFLKSHHFIWALIIAQLNTVVNPLLYGAFSENFRACFAKLWHRRPRIYTCTSPLPINSGRVS